MVYRPDLRIELIHPSFFQMSLPRQQESSGDGVHYFKDGSIADRKVSPDGSGDTLYCTGPVGAAFSRIIADTICNLASQPPPAYHHPHLHHHLREGG